MVSTVDSNKSYFLGALILKEQPITDGDRANGIAFKKEVVDGQRRLTTIAILLKMCYLISQKNSDFASAFLIDNDMKSPCIEHNFEDRPVFNKIMAEAFAAHRSEKGNIAETCNYFFDKLKNKTEIL